MNLLYGELVKVLPSEEDLRPGRVRVGGAWQKIPLELVTDAAPGDSLLLCDGVAIGRVAAGFGEPQEESAYVSRHSG